MKTRINILQGREDAIPLLAKANSILAPYMKKKTKYIQLPMKFNPGLNKFEPDLPLRKRSIKIERKKNNWAFWYIVIFSILLSLELLYIIISYFII